MKRKISELKPCAYGVPGPQISCEPSSQDICQAITNKSFELRPFSEVDQEVLRAEWTQAANGDIHEFARLQRAYHAKRIAFLVVSGRNDPIEVDSTGNITDGNHRVRAAIFRGETEIEVLIKPDSN